MPYFVVFQEAGTAWDHSRALEAQEGWGEHAAFMNQLEAIGFVVVGGLLLGGPHRALLVVHASSLEAVRSRLAADPWANTDVLHTVEIAPWDIRLGGLPTPR